MLGFLSPEGVFYECGFMCHMSTASELCMNIYKEEYICDPEGYLGEKGWMIILRRFAGISCIKSYDEGCPIFTDAQIEWILNNIDQLNNDQRYNISEQLEREQGRGKRTSIPEGIYEIKYDEKGFRIN
jgi:hypothetical protein